MTTLNLRTPAVAGDPEPRLPEQTSYRILTPGLPDSSSIQPCFCVVSANFEGQSGSLCVTFTANCVSGLIVIIPTPEFDPFFAQDHVSFRRKMLTYIQHEFADLAQTLPFSTEIQRLEALAANDSLRQSESLKYQAGTSEVAAPHVHLSSDRAHPTGLHSVPNYDSTARSR